METPSGFEGMISAMENNQLELPTMPDWAIKLQAMLDDIDVSASKIVDAISGDPVFTVQLIKTANSALYAGKPKVNTVLAAVSRVGYRTLRGMIMKLTISRLSLANQTAVRKQLDDFIASSRRVAAISYVLAGGVKGLYADQGLLAGLVHDIGILPICIYADKNIPDVDERSCIEMAHKYRGLFGQMLLASWSFPESLIAIPMAYRDLQREIKDEKASYIDIVTVAHLLATPSTIPVDWSQIAAISRLGLSEQNCAEFFAHHDDEVQTALVTFFGS